MKDSPNLPPTHDVDPRADVYAEQEEAIRLLLRRVLKGPLEPVFQELRALDSKVSELDSRLKTLQGQSLGLKNTFSEQIEDLAHDLAKTLQSLDEAVGGQGASSRERHAQAVTAIAAAHTTMLECRQALTAQAQQLGAVHEDVGERFDGSAAWHEERLQKDEQFAQSNVARIETLLERMSEQARRDTDRSIESLTKRLDELGATLGNMEALVTRVVLSRIQPSVRTTQWLVVAIGALAATASVVAEHLWNHPH